MQRKNSSKRRHHYHTNNFPNSSCATSRPHATKSCEKKTHFFDFPAHRMGLLMEVIQKNHSQPRRKNWLLDSRSSARLILSKWRKPSWSLLHHSKHSFPSTAQYLLVFLRISLKYIWKNRIQTSQWVSCRMLSLPVFISIELLLWWRWILHTMFVQKHRNMFVKHHLAIWVAFAHLQVFKCCRLFCQTDIPQLQWNLNTPSSPGSARSFAVKPRRGIANTFLSGASFISFCISVDMIHSACPIFADKFPIYLMQQHCWKHISRKNNTVSENIGGWMNTCWVQRYFWTRLGTREFQCGLWVWICQRFLTGRIGMHCGLRYVIMAFLIITCGFCSWSTPINWEKCKVNIATAILFPSTAGCDKDVCCPHVCFAVHWNGACQLGG